MEQVVGRTLEAGLRLQGGVERLDDALGAAPAALDDRADMAALIRQVVAGQVDARELEKLDAARAELRVGPDSVHEARQEPRAKDGQLDRDRLGQAPGIRGGIALAERRRARLD